MGSLREGLKLFALLALSYLDKLLLGLELKSQSVIGGIPFFTGHRNDAVFFVVGIERARNVSLVVRLENLDDHFWIKIEKLIE